MPLDIQQEAFRLALIIVMLNVLLIVTGAIPAANLQGTYKLMKNVNFDDSNKAAFQQGLVILNPDTNQPISNLTGGSTANWALSFVSAIPIIGPYFGIFQDIYDLFVNVAFGVLIVLQFYGVPGIIVIPLTILITVIYVAASYEFIMDLLRSLGIWK